MDAQVGLQRNSSEPLYLQIASYLRSRIIDGTFAPSAALPSEADLTALLNVSRPTVRQALRVLMEEGLIERVPGRGTFVSGGISTPTRQRTGTLAFIALEMRDTFLMRIFAGVEQVATQHNCHVILASTGNAISVEQRQLNELWEGGKIDGFILMPADSPTPHQTLRKLCQAGVPLVLVDRYFEDLEVPFVTSDNVRGGYLVTKHLLDLGHRRIGFVTRPNVYITSVAHRVQGYRQALKEAGVTYDPGLIFQALLPYLSEIQIMGKPSSNLVDYDREAIREFLSSPNRPSAVFACNEIIALQVMGVCRELGLRIPEDIAIAGYDDDQVAPILDPPLTTVRQDPRQMGILAATMLMNLLENRPVQKRNYIPVELILRQSSGAAL
jgi:GntR family transcriptional regulator of arabinose operon